MYNIYIYIRISSILYYIEQNIFLNVIVRPGIREQTCILIKEKRKRIEKEKRSKVCYYFKKRENKKPSLLQKKNKYRVFLREPNHR